MHNESDVDEMRSAMADATKPILIRDVARLDIRPGDKLLIRVPADRFTMQEAERIESVVKAVFGDVLVMVTRDDVEVSIVRGTGA